MSDDCVFCGIVRGTSPASIVYSDETTLAFMNIRQSNAGHVLVIPKAHIRTMDQLPLEVAGELFQTVVRVSRAIKATFIDDDMGMSLWQSNEAVAGQEIDHVHIHLLPHRRSDELILRYRQPPPPHEPRERLDALAAKLG